MVMSGASFLSIFITSALLIFGLPYLLAALPFIFANFHLVVGVAVAYVLIRYWR